MFLILVIGMIIIIAMSTIDVFVVKGSSKRSKVRGVMRACSVWALYNIIRFRWKLTILFNLVKCAEYSDYTGLTFNLH